MKKKILVLCSVLALVISLAVPAFATEATETTEDPLAGKWVFNDTLDTSQDFSIAQFDAPAILKIKYLVLQEPELFPLKTSVEAQNLYIKTVHG